MKILVDLTFINTQILAQKSLALYTYRFLEHIPGDIIPNITLYTHEATSKLIKEKFPKLQVLEQKIPDNILYRLPIIRSFLYMRKWNDDINKLNYDVVFIPYAVAKNSSKLKAKKVIVIHDLRPLKISDNKYINAPIFKFLGLSNLYFKTIRHYFNKHVNNANIIITISNYVKTDFLKIWPKAIDKIQVVYNGIPQSFNNTIQPQQISNFDKFILYVNNLLPYKNIITLVKSLESITNKSIKLVIVGKETDYWNNTVKPYITKRGISNRIIHLTYVTDAELNWLYSNATLFVSPSLNEGFGYTPIEAAINMCPVICTQCESLPDVTANKLYYYSPPTDEYNLAEAINNILANYPSIDYLTSISNFFKERYDQHKQTQKILSILTDNSICR